MAYNVEVTYEKYSDFSLIPNVAEYEGKTLEELPGLKRVYYFTTKENAEAFIAACNKENDISAFIQG